MNIAKRSTTLALVASMVAVGHASGQVIDYTTQGYFSGPGTGAPGVVCTEAAAATASCSGGGFALAFTGTSGLDLANNTITSLGLFNLTGEGSVFVPPNVIFFTLLVNQTVPTTGQAMFLGAISGDVRSVSGSNFSDLMWTPNEFANIPPVTYQVIYDDAGPANGIGLGIPIDNTRGIDALVTVNSTPEPATFAMLVPGLLGLAGVIRRRSRTT